MTLFSLPQVPMGRSARRLTRLQEALSLCEDITRRYSKSFYLTSALLPAEKRLAARALYAFCRLSDNIVDAEEQAQPEPEMNVFPGATPAERLERLESWRQAMRLPIAEQQHPVLLAWAVTRDQFSIPLRYSEELLDGMAMDLIQTRYATFDELWHYCYCAAATVGINSMYIIGFEDNPETFLRAEQLGVALQLTNILRDVGEDWGRGRIYLPQEDLRRFNYTEADLAAAVIDERYRALITFQMARTHDLYEAAWHGIPRLHADGQFAIAASAEIYRRIMEKIEAAGFDNFNQRAYVPQWEKLAMLPHIWRRLRSFKSLPEVQAA